MCLVPMAGPVHYVLNCGFTVTFPVNQDALISVELMALSMYSET